MICHFLSLSHSFLDGYCSSVQSLLDLFEVDLGFTKLWFIQTDLCVVCVFVLYSLAFSCPLWTRGEWEFSFKYLKQIFDSTHEDEGMWRSMLHVCVTTGSTWVRDTSFMYVWQQACGAVCFMCVWQQSLSVCSSSPHVTPSCHPLSFIDSRRTNPLQCYSTHQEKSAMSTFIVL